MTRDHDATSSLTLPRRRERVGRGRARSLLVRAALIAGCASLLGGCYTHGGRNDVMATAPSDYRLRHPIAIREKDHTVELFIGNNRGALTPPQRSHVLAFAGEWRREATGGIVIEAPIGSSNAAAAGGAVREVQGLLATAGVPANGVVVRGYRVTHPSRLATVRLNYPRMAAEAGPCGLWPSDIGPTTKSYRLNKPYWNFGCASQRNIAAMVANPADLAQPRGEAPVYSMRRTTVMENYRKGEQTSSKQPANDAAKISDVGK
jgi:pilus assembly protein CpaD